MYDILKAFKKLLGSGRAWLCVDGFTSELLNIFIEPLKELRDNFINLRYTHFPATYPDVHNTKNGEDLFGIKDSKNLSPKERALNVEAQWCAFSGLQNYKQIELLLRKKGLNIRVTENIPLITNGLYTETIGNGGLQTPQGMTDPIQTIDGSNCFFVEALDFLSDSQLNTLVDTVIKHKQAHQGVYYLARFLRKKEIHHVLTKSQMQTYKKSQYCKVGVN